MENNVKILMIVNDQWTGNDGKVKTDIIGLGDDSLLYRWHKGTGKWILNVITH